MQPFVYKKQGVLTGTLFLFNLFAKSYLVFFL